MKICLLVIDVQESFRQRDYFREDAAATYLAAQNRLIAGALTAEIPIVRILHTDGPDDAANPFSTASGHVRPLQGLADFTPAATFVKHRHSALVGTGLDVWLVENGIRRILVSGIRTEQCCETTTRHASDLGYAVDFVTEATLTFDMAQADGGTLSAADIRSRTETVLRGRFAAVHTVDELFAELAATELP